MVLVFHVSQRRRLTKRLRKPYIIILTILLLLLINWFELFRSHFMERDYRTEFSYPWNIELGPIVASLRSGDAPSVKPINLEYDITFTLANAGKCQTQGNNAELHHLVLIIKSDVSHTYQRNAIRISWGQENSIPGARVKRVFLVGSRPWEPDLQKRVEAEQHQHADLVQGSFWDTYYNNTYKTMMGFKWIVKFCSNTQYAFFVDDDMYVSVRNLLHFLRNPRTYPEYLEKRLEMSSNKAGGSESLARDPVRPLSFHRITETVEKLTNSTHASLGNAFSNSDKQDGPDFVDLDLQLPQDTRLYSGFVFNSSTPQREKSSKWYISLSEYPYNQWPPYATAGGFVLSRNALVDMYYTSFYTQPFRFDDIYIAILAKKAGVIPYHSDAFHFWKKDYQLPQDYKHVIVSHGYADFKELLRVWSEQWQAGYA